jgi:hypothetical protein
MQNNSVSCDSMKSDIMSCDPIQNTVIIVLIHGISSIIALLRGITVQMLWNCNGHWVGSWLVNMFTN